MTDNLRFGTSTSIFGARNVLTPAKLKTLEGTGLDYVEIAGLEPQHVNVWDDAHIDELAAYFESSPLSVWSFHAPLCAVAVDDADTRRAGVRQLVRAAHVAVRFGASIVVMHPGRGVTSLDHARETEWAVEGILRAADDIPDGVTLALETLFRDCSGGPPQEMAAIMERLPTECVGVCVDTGHVNLGFDVVEYIRHLPGRIVTTHLHDNHGDRDAHMMVGEGTVDFPSVVLAFKDAGYTGVWMNEGGSPGHSPDENVHMFVERMKKFLDSD